MATSLGKWLWREELMAKALEPRGWSIVTAARRSGMNPNYLGALEKGGNRPKDTSHQRH